MNWESGAIGVGSLAGVLQSAQEASEKQPQPIRQKNDAPAQQPQDKWDIWPELTLSQSAATSGCAPVTLETPSHEVSYLQSVGTGEVFLSLAQNSISTCQGIRVRVHLPGDSMRTIVVDVEGEGDAQKLVIRTPKFLLEHALAQEVDKSVGSAKWDAAVEQLTVDMPFRYTVPI